MYSIKSNILCILTIYSNNDRQIIQQHWSIEYTVAILEKILSLNSPLKKEKNKQKKKNKCESIVEKYLKIL